MPSSSEDADIYDREFTVERSDMDERTYEQRVYIKWAVTTSLTIFYVAYSKEMIVKYHKECLRAYM